MKDFSRRLKEERKRLGLNQSDFAALGGVKKDAQLNYENGTRIPDSAYLSALNNAGVDIFYVLTGEIVGQLLSTDERILISAYRQLNDYGKTSVLALTAGLKMTPEETAKAVFHGKVGQVISGNVEAPVNIDMKKVKK